MIRYTLLILERHSRLVSAGLAVAVFVLCSGLGLAGGGHFRYPDEHDYDRLARNIVEGRGYVDLEGRPTAYRPPGWPLVLAGVYGVWKHPLAARFANATFHGLTAWLLAILAARILPEGRIFAPLLVLLYPLGAYTAATLYAQTLGTLLLVAMLLLLDNGRSRVAAAAAAGVLLGALILTIPAFLLLLPLLLAGVLSVNRRAPSAALGRGAVLLVCAAAVVLPWSIRNTRQMGRFVPVATNSGVNLLLGNSEHTRPNAGVNVDIARYRAQVLGLDEAAADRQLQRFAVDWMVRHPARAARLYLRKVLNYFQFRNELHVQSEQGRWKDAIVFASYYPLLLLALLRLLWCFRRPLCATEVMLYLLYFGNAFASAIFFTRLRFRVPFDALLAVLAAGAIGMLVRSLRDRAVATDRGGRIPPDVSG